MTMVKIGSWEEEIVELKSGELNSPPSKMKILSRVESWGSGGHIDFAAIGDLPRGLTEDGKKKFFKIFNQLLQAVGNDLHNSDPKNIESGKIWREKAKRLFLDAGFQSSFGDPFFKAVPNEYGPHGAADKNNPWFHVFTNMGMFKIGWRRHVIHLEWTATSNRKKAKELFPNEDTTKSDEWSEIYYIHCWGYEKALEYLKKIKESATNP